jgi:hypothetical protein
MNIVLNKVLTGIVFSVDEWCYPYTLFTHSLIYRIGYEGMVFSQAVHLIHVPLSWPWYLTILILTFTRVCHISKQSNMHKPTSHFAQKYSVLLRLFVIVHMETTFSFWGPMLAMFHVQATYLGYRWTLSASRYVTRSHILLMGFFKLRTRTLLCHFYPHVFYGVGRYWGWPYVRRKKVLAHFQVLAIP